MEDAAPTRDRALLAPAVVLMLAGAAMLVSGATGAIPFALIAIGIAMTALVERRRRGRQESVGRAHGRPR